MSNLRFQSHRHADNGLSRTLPVQVRMALGTPKVPRVVMVGMHLSRTRGGITTLTSGIMHSRLKSRYQFSYIESQAEDYGRFRKLALAAGAVLRFAWRCMRGTDLAYIHVGSNASLYRESFFIVLAKLFRRTAICHFHAGDVIDYLDTQPRWARKFILRALGWSDHFIAVSTASSKDIRRLLPAAGISVLPNVIDAEWLNTTTPTDLKAESGKIRILFVGSAGKLKGEHDLIAALKLVRERGVNVNASLLGYGAEKLKDLCVKAGISDMIEHLGPVSMEERGTFFRNADIFVLPTYAEAMPVSVMEAMAAGLPIITTTVGGIPEIIDDGKDGLLFECGDVNALAEKIILLSSDEEMRERLGSQARTRAKEYLNFDRYIDDLESQIERFIKR